MGVCAMIYTAACVMDMISLAVIVCIPFKLQGLFFVYLNVYYQ